MANRNEQVKPSVIGKAKILPDKYAEWFSSEENYKKFMSSENLWQPYLYNLYRSDSFPGIHFSSITDMWYSTYGGEIANMQKYVSEVMSEVDKPYDLLYAHEVFCIIRFGYSQYILPSFCVEYDLFKDYSKLSIQAIKYLNGEDRTSEQSLIPIGNALSGMSQEAQSSLIADKQAQLDQLKSDIQDVKDAKTGELAEMQAKIDEQMKALEAKKREMMEVLEAKKAEMELQKKLLETELFMLESEIYSIRCFLGETVDFVKVRSGACVPAETPLTVFQKLRYLDEELGKICSIYNVDFNEAKYFESLLAKNDEILDTFCPNDKCVSPVRVSRSCTNFSYSTTVWGTILEEYAKYHGGTIGIIIRDGGNVYIGWTDDKKINFSEDLFYTPKVTENPDDGNSEKSTDKEDMVGRYFVFSILQGVIEHSNMINLPQGSKILKQSEYVIWSAADAWLVDNRFGSFRDIVNKTSGKYKVGNYILMWDSLSDGRLTSQYSFNRSYERGRGESSLTGDAYVSSGKIYKINVIDEGDPVWIYKYGVPGETVYTTRRWNKWDEADRKFSDPRTEVFSETVEYENEIYISVLKSSGDTEYVYDNGNFTKRKREARANFRIYEGEFIDLTYLNSVWLKYVITTRNLGYSQKEIQGNYASAIKYLNTALQHITLREREEREAIIKYYPELDSFVEWQIKLSEWKYDNNVSVITDYQAKRFAKVLMNSEVN